MSRRTTIPCLITSLVFLPGVISDSQPHYYEHQTFTPSFCQIGTQKWSDRLCWEVTGGIFATLLFILITIPLSLLASQHRTRRRLKRTYEDAEEEGVERAEAKAEAKAREKARELLGPVGGSGGGGFWGASDTDSGGWEKREEMGVRGMPGMNGRIVQPPMDDQQGAPTPPSYTSPSPPFRSQPDMPLIQQLNGPPTSPARNPLSRAGPMANINIGGDNVFENARPFVQTPAPSFGAPFGNVPPPGSTQRVSPVPHPGAQSYPSPQVPLPTNYILPELISSVANFSFDTRPLSQPSSILSPISPLSPSPMICPILQAPAPLVPKRNPARTSTQTQSSAQTPGGGGRATGRQDDVFRFPVPPSTGNTTLMAKPLGQALGYHLPARMMARRALSIDTVMDGGGVFSGSGPSGSAGRLAPGGTQSSQQLSSPNQSHGNARSASDGTPSLRMPTAALMRPSPTSSGRSLDGSYSFPRSLMDSLERSEGKILSSVNVATTIATSLLRPQRTSSTIVHPRQNKLRKATSSTSLASSSSSIRSGSTSSHANVHVSIGDGGEGMHGGKMSGPEWHRERMMRVTTATGRR